MIKVTLPECSKGPWKIEKFTVDRMDFHALVHGREVPLGETYTRLMKNGSLVMSDTPAEMNDHWEAVFRAKGSCLLMGLGLGMVLKTILVKERVTDVTVVEISQNLIDLVGPHYPDPRVTMICADALQWTPPKGKRYQMVWHDIWSGVSTDDLVTMKALRQKYVRRAEWQGCWGLNLLRRWR